MKYKLVVAACACALTFLSAGCYTQLSTREPSEDRYADEQEGYAPSDDTTNGTTINNYYFGDDAYRHSRFHMAFSYYSPYTWGGYWGIYDPWYSDPWYWTDGWRPYVLYPYPTWYPNGGYYGHRYWGYYSDPFYDPWYYPGGIVVGGSGQPHRTRLTGSTRGDDRFGTRSRLPLATPAGSGGMGVTTIGGTGTAPTTGIRTRGNTSDERGVSSTPAQANPQTTTRTRGNDVPWWERVNQEEKRTQQSAPAATGTQPERRRRVEQAPAANNGATQATPGSTQGTAAPADHPKRERRTRSNDGGQSGGRQQSVAPAPQSQPRYSPPANNGGGRERSSGGSQSGGSSSGGSRSRGRER